jgi:hypothetical protein
MFMGTHACYVPFLVLVALPHLTRSKICAVTLFHYGEDTAAENTSNVLPFILPGRHAARGTIFDLF